MDTEKCQICQKEFSAVKSLHLHVAKAHKVGQVEYYQKYYPKRDKYTLEKIVFKNRDQYFESDFNSRESFAKWCIYHENKQEVRDYCVSLLNKRIADKGICVFPSQVELKGILLPSYYGWVKVFGTWENAREAIRSTGLTINFRYEELPVLREGFLDILIDTREQNPLNFKDSKIMKLSCGDYTCAGELYDDLFVERKSLPDLIGSLSSGYDRFCREIERAKDLDYYLVVIIEDTFESLMNYSPLNGFSKILTGRHILYKIREVLSRFDNIQFLFSGDRGKSKEYIEKILRIGKDVRNYDLEQLKDGGLL